MAKSQLRAMGPTKIGEGKRYISQRDKQLGVSLHAYIYKYLYIWLIRSTYNIIHECVLTSKRH